MPLRFLHTGFHCNSWLYRNCIIPNDRIHPINDEWRLCNLTSPLTTASLKTIRVVFPNVGDTGGANESSRYPPQCWITCRTHVNPRYFDLFIPSRTGVEEFDDRRLRVLLRDVRDEGTLEVQASFGAAWLRDFVPEEAYLLCWRYLMVLSTLAWWKMENVAFILMSSVIIHTSIKWNLTCNDGLRRRRNASKIT